MQSMKNTHQSGFVRPVKMIKAIAFLKDCGNPYYTDVILRCTFCNKQFKDDDDNVLAHVEDCHLKFLADTNENEPVDQSIDKNEELDEVQDF